jgi:2Fe-2S ferredoxin
MSDMPKISVLPHPEYTPDGKQFETTGPTSLCDALLDHGVEIEHACGKVGACTTCHVIVKQGFDSLNAPDENEEDMLDRAWGLQPQSRLSCQAIVADADLVVEIPQYSVNLAKETPPRS